jgi:hypothetical protein
MHVIFRETHGMEENAVPQDLGQQPADLVVLSFSDSDLGAFAAAWHGARAANDDMPSLRLANLSALMHPLSVDTYVERTLSGAKAILIRLIGGTPYWSCPETVGLMNVWMRYRPCPCLSCESLRGFVMLAASERHGQRLSNWRERGGWAICPR